MLFRVVERLQLKCFCVSGWQKVSNNKADFPTTKIAFYFPLNATIHTLTHTAETLIFMQPPKRTQKDN